MSPSRQRLRAAVVAVAPPAISGWITVGVSRGAAVTSVAHVGRELARAQVRR
jgi:hypothetical protein